MATSNLPTPTLQPLPVVEGFASDAETGGTCCGGGCCTE